MADSRCNTPAARFIPRRICCAGIIIISLVVLLVACDAGAVNADGAGVMVVRETGMAPGANPNAREAAARNARHAALLRVLESIVGAKHTRDVTGLLENPGKFVLSTRITDQSQTDGITKVELSLRIREEALRDAAADLLSRQLIDRPRVLLVTTEIFDEAGEGMVVATPDSVSHRVFADAMKGARIELARPGPVLARYSETELAQRITGELDLASDFAKKSDADSVVLVNVEERVERLSTGANVHLSTAEATARVFRAPDGKLLEAATQKAAVHSANPVDGLTQAVTDACRKLTGLVVRTVIFSACDDASENNAIITIKKPGDRIRLSTIVAAITEVAGESTVEELYFTRTEAKLRVKYAGPIGPLVDNLVLQDFGGFVLRPRRVVARDVVLEATDV